MYTQVCGVIQNDLILISKRLISAHHLIYGQTHLSKCQCYNCMNCRHKFVYDPRPFKVDASSARLIFGMKSSKRDQTFDNIVIESLLKNKTLELEQNKEWDREFFYIVGPATDEYGTCEVSIYGKIVDKPKILNLWDKFWDFW